MNKIEQLVLIKDNNDRLQEILGEDDPGDDSMVFDKIKMDVTDGLSDGDDDVEDDYEED